MSAMDDARYVIEDYIRAVRPCRAAQMVLNGQGTTEQVAAVCDLAEVLRLEVDAEHGLRNGVQSVERVRLAEAALEVAWGWREPVEASDG